MIYVNFLGVKEEEKFKIDNSNEYSNTFIVRDNKLHYWDSCNKTFKGVTQASIYTDLFNYGVIPFLEFSEDEKKLLSIVDKDWVDIGRDITGHLYLSNDANFTCDFHMFTETMFQQIKRGTSCEIKSIVNGNL